ncbi:MAG: lipopolysaccharide biosynthesis protein [Kiritimatiellia bacterium]|jgi:O-antigen/teichoic acid export membrane protein
MKTVESALPPLPPRDPPSGVGGWVLRFFRLERPGALARRTYFWTALSGGCFSASSFVLLLLVVRLLGEQGPYWGGVFSIALAISQQLITIGLFQVRPFQVSDVDETYSFGDYLVSRMLTVGLMGAAGAAWIAATGVGRDKTIAILLLLALRAGESFSDVFEGRYQQLGRLDIASKGMFFKTLLPMGLFGVALWLTRDLFAALAWMALLYWLLLIGMDALLIPSFARLNLRTSFRKQRQLFLACLPLATNAFLFIYLNNLSRYTIDRFLDERRMTEYNALFMLSFLVVLLSSFVLRPAMTRLALTSKKGDMRGFRRQIGQQLAWIVAFTMPTLILAYFWGTPVLSLIYGIDLTPYRNALCLLIVGGSLVAAYYVFQSILIIRRRQTACLIGILLAVAASHAFTPFAVRSYGVAGGAASFFFSALILSLIFMVLTIGKVRSASTARSPDGAPSEGNRLG